MAATIAETASVLVLPTLGDANVLRMTPPLVISDAELELAVDGIASVCARLDGNAAATIVRAIGAVDAPASAAPVADAGAEPAVALPRLVRGRAAAPDYAFVVHLTSPEDLVAADPSLRVLTAEELRRFCGFTAALGPGVLMRAPTIRSSTGAVADGVILVVPLLPDEMARRGVEPVARDIAQAVDLAGQLGARVVGLGGYTVPYSRRGLAVVGRGPAVTTGNALTAGMAVAATRRLAEAQGLALGDARVAVVGARGSVGTLCARLVARERPRRMLLVGNPSSANPYLERLRRDLAEAGGDIQVATDLDRLHTCDVVITATAAGRPILDAEAQLAPGTIVCDVARPPDTSPGLRRRRDLTVIDGGLVTLPDPAIRFGAGNFQNLPDGVQLACLAETILLALAGETRDWGIGYDVPVEEVDRVLALADRHGFRLAPPTPTREARRAAVERGPALTAGAGHAR